MAVAAVGADKKGGKRRLASAAMFALLGASLLAACAPLGPQTVEPIVEQANTTEAGATIPTYAELVAEAMGGGFDPDSLEPEKAAALEQLRQTFFIRKYDTDGDQQLDGPILSELGENTVQWAVDGVTPYLAGKEINEVYGGGTDTALLVSGFRPGEPLVLSVAGANAELANQGVPANGKYLVVMSPTHAVVTDEQSNPVAEVGADGVWRAMEVAATEVPTEIPEPTAEPTTTPAPTETPEPTLEPTPAGPETYGMVLPQATMEEIEKALENLRGQTIWPSPRFGSGWLMLGVLANHRFTDVYLDPGRTEHVRLMSTFYYKGPDGTTREFDVPLYIENRETGWSRTIGEGTSFVKEGSEISWVVRETPSYGDLTKPSEAILEDVSIQVGVPKPTGVAPEFVPELGFYWVYAEDYIEPLNEYLGITVEDIRQFTVDGDPDRLPLIDGRPFMIPIRGRTR